jgi:hypothetical protein
LLATRDITVGELMEKAMERRKNLTSQRFNFGYHVEAADEPGIFNLLNSFEKFNIIFEKQTIKFGILLLEKQFFF